MTSPLSLIAAGLATRDGQKLDPFLPVGKPGTDGCDGWTPILGGEADGVRSLLKVFDWTGGEGTKPKAGMYIGVTGYVAAKADAFNFNIAKRVSVFSAVSGTGGIATISFTMSPAFAAPPAAIAFATPAALAGVVKAEIVAGTLTKAGCQVKVTSAALLTGVITALVGATVQVLAIEA
jgi:hypothetical protein